MTRPKYQYGDLLHYHRHRDGKRVVGRVDRVVPQMDESVWLNDYEEDWAYRLSVSGVDGTYRTVTESRLSRVSEVGSQA